MKTLDEVISEVAKRRDLDNDIYHYLHEYRTLQYGYIKAMADLEDNPPLSWDELKQMEGKPVWIELTYQIAWGLNDGTYIDAFGHEVLTIKVLHDLWHLDKALMGKAWKAYRKERKK